MFKKTQLIAMMILFFALSTNTFALSITQKWVESELRDNGEIRFEANTTYIVNPSNVPGYNNGEYLNSAQGEISELYGEPFFGIYIWRLFCRGWSRDFGKM
jgi:hypothetical protein